MNSPTQKKARLFHSPKLVWPFIASIPALIIIWTIFAKAYRLVNYNDTLVFGVFIGLLSSVILFAIMKAIDQIEIYRSNSTRGAATIISSNSNMLNDKPISDDVPRELVKPNSVVINIAIDNIRKIVANDLSCRPDLLADRFLRTGYCFNKGIPEWPGLNLQKMTNQQRSSLPSEYFRQYAIDFDELGRVFGFPKGDDLIEALMKLENGRKVSGLGFDEYFYMLVDDEIKRRLDQSASRLRIY